jgi:hypothetical protein
MVHTVQKEMQHQEKRTIRHPLVDMEQESMHSILEQRPDDISNQEAYQGLDDGVR